MHDTQLYQTILGLTAPWRVERVALDPTTKQVNVSLGHDDVRWPCPTCQQPLACRDHAPERAWRHLAGC